MKTLIYNILIILAIFIGAQTETLSQTTHYHYRFSYDSSGNREKRIYIGTELKSATIEGSTAFKKEEPLIDKVGFGEIKIYPNPTKGNLVVEIPDLEAEAIRLLIFNLQGKQLVNKNVSPNTRTQLNMNSFLSGMYIMKVVAGKESSDWKIIKN